MRQRFRQRASEPLPALFETTTHANMVVHYDANSQDGTARKTENATVPGRVTLQVAELDASANSKP